MFKNLKKFIAVTFAALTLSLGVGTVAPNSAEAAHWADTQINWAMSNGYLKTYNPNKAFTREETWLVLSRYHSKEYNRKATLNTYAQAQQFVMDNKISDGTNGTDYITRNEAAVMVIQSRAPGAGWEKSLSFAKYHGIFDGTRGDYPATQAEIIAMMYNVENFFG